jgi:hypothetical protein
MMDPQKGNEIPRIEKPLSPNVAKATSHAFDPPRVRVAPKVLPDQRKL